jgi:acyl carrier protein
MPTVQETTEQLLRLTTTHFDMPRGRLAPEDDFFLNLDSLDARELLSLVENHFGIELSDYEMQSASDFKTLAERILSRM